MSAADEPTGTDGYIEAMRALSAWTRRLGDTTPQEDDGIATIYGTLFHWAARADVVEAHAEARRDGFCAACRIAGTASTDAMLSKIDEVIGELRGDEP